MRNRMFVYSAVFLAAFMASVGLTAEKKKEITLTGRIELLDDEDENSPLIIVDDEHVLIQHKGLSRLWSLTYHQSGAVGHFLPPRQF